MIKKTTRSAGKLKKKENQSRRSCRWGTAISRAASVDGLPRKVLAMQSLWIERLHLGRFPLQLVDEFVCCTPAADVVLDLAHHEPVPFWKPHGLCHVAGSGSFELLGSDLHVLPGAEGSLHLRILNKLLVRRSQAELERPAPCDMVLAVFRLAAEKLHEIPHAHFIGRPGPP